MPFSPNTDPKFAGTKTYRIGPAGHYRQGQMYAEGDLLTVTNEKPGKDWVLVEEAKPAVKHEMKPEAKK